MAAFLESPRFPDTLSFGAQGGPEFETDITRTNSHEYAISRRQFPLQKWNVSPAVRSQTDYSTLLGFFMVAMGRAGRFRFRDPIDNTESHGNATGVVTAITATTFQLTKRYAAGSQTIDRPIKKPVAAGFMPSVSGTPLGGGSYSLDTTTGILTIGSAPSAATVTWTGFFDVPASFDLDHLPALILDKSAGLLMIQCSTVTLREVPL